MKVNLEVCLSIGSSQKMVAACLILIRGDIVTVVVLCVTDTEMTSPVMTSSAAGGSAPHQQPALVVFGDLLSSMHREVESSLRQSAALDDASAVTSDGASTSLLAATAPPPPPSVVTLSSSPCVRDVCDAIIVHALRHCSDTPPGDEQATDSGRPRETEMRPPQSTSEAESRLTDTAAHYSQPRQVDATPVTGSGQQSRMRSDDPDMLSPSRQSEMTLHNTSPGQDTTMNSSQLTGSNVEQTSPVVDDPAAASVGTGTGTTSMGTITTDTSGTGTEPDGVVKKPEGVVSSHEADDVDVDDQPLCIDLNRDTSPDNDVDDVTQ